MTIDSRSQRRALHILCFKFIGRETFHFALVAKNPHNSNRLDFSNINNLKFIALHRTLLASIFIIFPKKNEIKQH